MAPDIIQIAKRFALKGTPISAAPLGNGLINDTYLVKTEPESAPDYVIQRINNQIFTDVDLLQNNIEAITSLIRRRLDAQGCTDSSRRTLTVVPALDGSLYQEIDGNFWRATIAIPDTRSHENVTEKMAELTGRAFGEFHSYFTGSDVPEIKETIPDFHNVGFRITQLREAARDNKAGHLAEVKEIVDTLLAREQEMTLASSLHNEGKLPKRITHCDTKVNNILFDQNDNPLCVIDLDTTMPGFVLSDFGDFMRTAANTGAEDDPDLERVEINLDIFKAFARGYIATAKFLTPLEKQLLPYGAQMLTYMQTVRFLTDYLNGDVYYKTAFPGHNLQRTRAQLKLLSSIDTHLQEMKDYIDSL